MAVVYNDEDNVPMTSESFDRIDQDGHNPTTYGSYAEMRAAEKALPFDETPSPENGCWNCQYYDGDRCSIWWNNADPVYYLPDRDDKKPDDICGDWKLYEDAVWEDYFDEQAT